MFGLRVCICLAVVSTAFSQVYRSSSGMYNYMQPHSYMGSNYYNMMDMGDMYDMAQESYTNSMLMNQHGFNSRYGMMGYNPYQRQMPVQYQRFGTVPRQIGSLNYVYHSPAVTYNSKPEAASPQPASLSVQTKQPSVIAVPGSRTVETAPEVKPTPEVTTVSTPVQEKQVAASSVSQQSTEVAAPVSMSTSESQSIADILRTLLGSSKSDTTSRRVVIL